MKLFKRKCEHEWELSERSNIIQFDDMGYPLRLFICRCKKCDRVEQMWLDSIVSKNDHVLKWTKETEVPSNDAVLKNGKGIKNDFESQCTKQYIRFGDIPEDRISKVHHGDGIYKNEAGVSVWNCAYVNNIPFPLLPPNASESAMADYFYMLLGDKPVYLVEGTELCTKGSAGEPLLSDDIRIVKDCTEDYDYIKSILNHHKG